MNDTLPPNAVLDSGGTILIVDDTVENLTVLGRMLTNAGYKVRPARSGELALRSAQKAAPDLVLLDVRMPEMDGYEVCRRIKQDPELCEIPVVFISALQDVDDKVRAFREGGVDFIVKPFQMEEVMARVRTHISLSRARSVLKSAYDDMERRVDERTRELYTMQQEQAASARKLQDALVKTIEAMAIAVEKRDPYTAGHQKRVSRLAVAIARKLDLPQDQVDGIGLGGLVHDVGKIYVPAEILSRPGRISETEMELMRTHAQVGYDILRGIDFPWPVAEMVLQHQERWDGSGYPRKLKGEEILLEARILATADVLEAMSSHRPYRPALGIEAALEELAQNRGILYYPPSVDAALSLFRDDHFSL